MNDFCAQHMDMVKDMATVKQVVMDMSKSFDDVKARMVSHVHEGERPGGVRDRLLLLEQEISTIKKGYWKACIVAGVIGGLLADATPEVIKLIISFFK